VLRGKAEPLRGLKIDRKDALSQAKFAVHFHMVDVRLVYLANIIPSNTSKSRQQQQRTRCPPYSIPTFSLLRPWCSASLIPFSSRHILLTLESSYAISLVKICFKVLSTNLGFFEVCSRLLFRYFWRYCGTRLKSWAITWMELSPGLNLQYIPDLCFPAPPRPTLIALPACQVLLQELNSWLLIWRCSLDDVCSQVISAIEYGVLST